MWEMLRSKNFLILILFIIATSISIWLVTMPSPNIRNIMTETHKQITNLKNMNMMGVNVKKPDLGVDETYLELLGFVKKPKLYGGTTEEGVVPPVVVTGVTSKNYEEAFLLIDSVRKYLKDRQVLIFDLGMGSYELVKLQKHCNVSTSCTVKSFDFDKFPKHLRDMDIKAFKPVAVQEALNQYGAIIWTDTSEYFITGELQKLLDHAEKKGIAAWTIKSAEPTSALTHPKMFAYFKTRSEQYNFHRMVDSNHLILYNTELVHTKLMRPWVQCALHVECIWPTGAQNVGCHTHRKPKFIYSGCHKYDMSALNVILGLMFGYDNGEYIVKQEIFGIETKEESVENTTARHTTR